MSAIAYIIVFAGVFGALDAVWLKSSNSLYMKHLGHLMRKKPNFTAAIIFYLIYVIGITWFALLPSANVGDAAFQAGFLGLVCYATYDLTNLATVKDWPVKIVLIDLVWGTLASAAAAAATYGIVDLVVK